MRTRRTVTALAALALLGAGCGGGATAPGLEEADGQEQAADPTAQELDGLSAEELVARAEEEGTVTVYSFTSRIAEVETAFEAEYPEIDLVGLDISSTEQITRLQAEAEAGATEADVAYISDAPVVIGELLEDDPDALRPRGLRRPARRVHRAAARQPAVHQGPDVQRGGQPRRPRRSATCGS